jgi:ATP-binding cassette subfamily B protein
MISIDGPDGSEQPMNETLARLTPSAEGSLDQPSVRERMWRMIGPRRKLIGALGFLAILSALTEAVTLALIAQIAATLVKPKGSHVQLALLHIHAPTKTLILAAFAVSVPRLLLLQIPLAILPARIVADVWASLRRNLFQSYTHASWAVQSRDREGQLQEIMTNQAGQAGFGVANALALMTSTLTFLVLIASAFALDLLAALIVLVLGVCMFALLRPLRGLGVRRARALSKAQLRYAAGLAESIRVAEETQVFGAGAAQRRRLDELVARSRRLLFQTQLLTRLGSNITEGFTYLLLVGGLFLLHVTGTGRVGSLGAVVLILVRASSSGQNIQSAYQGVIQAIPFIERTQETERRYRESAPPEGTTPMPAVRTLAFDGVGYSYRPGRPVLSDIHFEVGDGEVVGIIGPSGAGKSTLVQLLLRLRLPDQGRYLVNGIPAEEITQTSWRQRVTYVPQEPRLLHASVADNIRYFRDIDDEAVERAARLARIHDDVIGWRSGYETIVGPRADAVSGGQRQRICLARALAARPEVLVLDEPTSALDPGSEALIQESLKSLKQQLTLFIVAHRMSTLDICDRVMIIIDGKLTAFDTLELLQRDNSYYRSASTHAAGATLAEPAWLLDASPTVER